MPNRVRTLAQLFGQFPDNTLRLIKPTDARDFVQTAFGYSAAADPTANNDNIDSALIGQFFDVGNRWLNTATRQVWRCWSGAPGAAVWVPDVPIVSNGEIFAGPQDGSAGLPTFQRLPMLGRLTGGPLYNANLKKTGISGTATSVSNIISGIASADMEQLSKGMLIEPSGGFPGNPVVLSTDFAAGTITVNMEATSTSAITFDATPLTYEWRQMTPGDVTGGAQDQVGGIVGTQATGPAFEVNATLVSPVENQQVIVWFRGVANGIPTYEFQQIFSQTPALLSTAQPISTTAINLQTGGPTVNLANTLIINGSNQLVFIDVALNPHLIFPAAENPLCMCWKGPFTVFYNEFGPLGDVHVLLYTLGTNEVIYGWQWQTVLEFVDSLAVQTTWTLQLEYSGVTGIVTLETSTGPQDPVPVWTFPAPLVLQSPVANGDAAELRVIANSVFAPPLVQGEAQFWLLTSTFN